LLQHQGLSPRLAGGPLGGEAHRAENVAAPTCVIALVVCGTGGVGVGGGVVVSGVVVWGKERKERKKMIRNNEVIG
jgi:hypothetical protein